MMLKRQRASAWDLDSPDELAALERLDPNLRGLADNAVFRYLRYQSRARVKREEMAAHFPLLIAALGILAIIIALGNQFITTYGFLIPAAVQLLLGGFRSGPQSHPDLLVVRGRSHSLDFGVLTWDDIARGFWAHFTRVQMIENRQIALILLVVAIAALALRGFWGAFLSSTFAGCAGLLYGANRAAHFRGLAEARKQVRLSMGLDSKPFWSWALANDNVSGEHGEANPAQRGMSVWFCVPLIIIPALVATLGVRLGIDVEREIDSRSLAIVAEILLHIFIAFALMGCGWAVGPFAYKLDQKDYDPILAGYHADCQALVEFWNLSDPASDQRIGTETCGKTRLGRIIARARLRARNCRNES